MTLEQAISGIEKLTQKAADKGKEFMEDAIIRHGHVESGTMSNSVVAQVYSMWAADVVVAVPYAHYVNDGRGPVRPVNARVLHWNSPKYGEVFAMYASPYAGTHFAEEAARQLDAYPFSLI